MLERGINGFQRRLVHQFVRAFHPDLVTISRGTFIQIVPFDKAREDANQARRDRAFEQNVETQIGLRWPVEAIAGGDLSGLTAGSFLIYVEGRQETVSKQLLELKATLQQKRAVLVGHNIFMDLMYFYQCFFGQLPDRVEDFQRALHRLFPVIIDTKYLATHGHTNPVLAKSSLEELAAELTPLRFPTIQTHENHAKYTFSKPAHEAGYDSFLTAKVLIRLSAKLESEGEYVDEDMGTMSDEDYFTPIEEEIPVTTAEAPGTAIMDTARVLDYGGVSGDVGPSTNSSPPPGQAKVATKFSHAGKYDLLEGLPQDSNQVSIAAPEPGSSAATGNVQDSAAPMMPPFDSHFWVVYGNKLRVNGTVEGVCNVLGE